MLFTQTEPFSVSADRSWPFSSSAGTQVEGKLELPSVKAMLQELELEKCYPAETVRGPD